MSGLLALRRAATSPLGGRRLVRQVESVAASLDTVARALKIIVLREYHIDLDAPPPTRREMRAEVWEPRWPDNTAEAIREEAERLLRLERDTDRSVRERVTAKAMGAAGEPEGGEEIDRIDGIAADLDEIPDEGDER